MAKRTTYAEITQRLIDESAKPDVTYAMTDLFVWSSLPQLKDDVPTVEADGYVSTEHNAWLADGTKQIVPDDTAAITWGMWSNSLTDAAGDFAAPPMLQATFASNHTTAGFTFYFAGDTLPRTITIEWRQGVTLLDSETFTVTGAVFFARNAVVGFNDVRVYFNNTRVPKRRVKLAEIDFGQVKIWTLDNLIRARAVEETDPTASELVLGSLDLQIKDPDDDFNALTPGGLYAAILKNQSLTVKEYVNGVATDMGKYYTAEWDSPALHVAAFRAYNALTFLDTAEYKTSALWSATAASTIFTDIFTAAGWTSYTVDAAIGAEAVSGYIPVVSCREALQQLCLALRAVVIVKRDGTIWITRLPSADATKAVELTDKMGTAPVKQRTYKNSVAVTAYSLVLDANSSTLYTAALTTGTYEVTFNRAAGSLTPTNATITASGVNWCKFTVAGSVTVTITGKYYTPTGRLYTVEDAGLTAATRQQATVEGVYLISTANGQAVAQFLYDMYQKRSLLRFTQRMDNKAVGDNLDVDTQYGARKAGMLTRADIDLTGGYLGDCEVIG